jgi:hypothetical protein
MVRRSGRAVPRLIPPGDLLSLYTALLRRLGHSLPGRLRLYFRRQTTAAMSVTALSAAGALEEGGALHGLVVFLQAVERHLQRWPVAGLAIAGLVVLVVALARLG